MLHPWYLLASEMYGERASDLYSSNRSFAIVLKTPRFSWIIGPSIWLLLDNKSIDTKLNSSGTKLQSSCIVGRISKHINSLLLERVTGFLPFLFLLYRNHIITIIAIYFILKQHFASQAQTRQLIVLGTLIYTKSVGLKQFTRSRLSGLAITLT